MKLAVVGSINMDMTVTAERIPLKGETLRADSISRIPGGKGANQAVAMARLGAEKPAGRRCQNRSRPGPGGSPYRAGHDHSGGK